jgi:ABC-type transporter Mla maintaining outer membrane lipid asymmetry ATPase subunit MlaF
MSPRAVAIARAVHFNARIMIIDEPTAALGPAETSQVRSLIKQLKSEVIGIFLISHDIHDVFDLPDRISVMLHQEAPEALCAASFRGTTRSTRACAPGSTPMSTRRGSLLKMC